MKSILLKFWDHIDKHQTANRNEYSEKEQNNIIQKFFDLSDTYHTESRVSLRQINSMCISESDIYEKVIRDMLIAHIKQLPIEEVRNLFNIEEFNPFNKTGKEFMICADDNDPIFRKLEQLLYKNEIEFKSTILKP